ncbi:hypothetical protein L1987_07166 [Smallanthus sonchifolius]|uniref:Uncharacterized protein n=1 Tax=Smallanthus sonchifolius TaxID=185202 RepID=A0ACB9K067_9ASTR|nr:hypothetical protein L1987_07166 [Smallanthus sonchifolius]
MPEAANDRRLDFGLSIRMMLAVISFRSSDAIPLLKKLKYSPKYDQAFGQRERGVEGRLVLVEMAPIWLTVCAMLVIDGDGGGG